MLRPALALLALAGAGGAEEGDVVFRSDVALMRIDVQVLDRSNRPIMGLQAPDFILREEGQVRKITAVEAEDMPVDVLLLLDVSGSMRPNIQLVASASRQALNALGEQDRVAIMVFDRGTRLRMGFSGDHNQIHNELTAVIDREGFDGGTDIPRAISDASYYIARNARKQARRAIVIVTDDQNERAVDSSRMSRSLLNAEAVLSVLLAPDAYGRLSRQQGGNWPTGGGGGSTWPRRRGGTWPGGGGGGWPPIILGPGSGGGNGPVVIGGRGQAAGTPGLARESGGDSMPVNGASAFADTLERIRQRYALHFQLPPGAKAGQERRIQVELADNAARRYAGADLRYRSVYLSPGSVDSESPETQVVFAENQTQDQSQQTASGEESPRRGGFKRRPNVSEPGGPRGPNPELSAGPAPAAEETSPSEAPSSAEAPKKGGWRVLKPGEQP